MQDSSKICENIKNKFIQQEPTIWISIGTMRKLKKIDLDILPSYKTRMWACFNPTHWKPKKSDRNNPNLQVTTKNKNTYKACSSEETKQQAFTMSKILLQTKFQNPKWKNIVQNRTNEWFHKLKIFNREKQYTEDISKGFGDDLWRVF